MINNTEDSDDDRSNEEDDSDWEIDRKFSVNFTLDCAFFLCRKCSRGKETLTSLVLFDTPRLLRGVNSDRKTNVRVFGKGTVTLFLDSKSQNVEILDVLYVPAASRNLLSVRKLTRLGYKCLLDDDRAVIINKHTNGIVAVAPVVGDFYILQFTADSYALLTENAFSSDTRGDIVEQPENDEQETSVSLNLSLSAIGN